nr:reverse transcriptase domain-containing protein [Tanacetum cinerariifolium]
MFGADHAGYTDRFHELEELVPHLVTPEEFNCGGVVIKVFSEFQ